MTALILIEGTDSNMNTNVAWYVYQGLKRYASANMYWNEKGLEESSAAEKNQDKDQKKNFYATMIVRKQTVSISTHGNKWNWVKGAIDDEKNEGGIIWARRAAMADIHIQCVDMSVAEIAELVEKETNRTPLLKKTVDTATDVKAMAKEIVSDIVMDYKD